MTPPTPLRAYPETVRTPNDDENDGQTADINALRFVYLSLIAEQLPKQHVRPEQPRRRVMTDEELAEWAANPSNHFDYYARLGR